MRGLRTVGAVAGLGLLVLSSVVGVVGGSRLAEAQVDQSLTARSLEAASTIEEYFERARTIDLLMANIPAVQDYFVHAEGQPEVHGGADHRLPTQAMNSILAYLEEIYPTRIGEACVIDRRGVEVARVVRGEAATHDELSHDEAANDFFRAAFALRPGQVYQSAPYRSPDTGEWVISNSTKISTRHGRAPAIVHFEITLDSFRAEAERSSTHTDLQIIDADTGRILVETGRPQVADAPLGRPSTDLSARIAGRPQASGVLSLDGQRVAYRRVPSSATNANDWVVVATIPDTVTPLSTGPGRGALAAALGSAVLLALWLVSARSGQRVLRRQATTDALTGLANRTVLHERLRAALHDRRSHGLSALLLIDLDGFKEVNDTLGHSRGDVLLCQVAERIRGQIRPGDLASRLGGDEFGLLMVGVDGVEALEAIAVRVLDAIRRPYRLDDVGMHVGASIGIAIVGDHGEEAELLLQRADVAMYQAKAAGVGHVLYDPTTDQHSADRLGLTAALLEAIEERSVGLHYQPKVDVQSGTVVGVEALVRWVHPELGLVRPDDFITVAEKTGLIRLLTECVLDRALAQCRTWLDEGRHLPVAINCSAVDLVDERFVDQVASCLEAHRIPAEMLRLEITESAIMVDPERSCRMLEHLHAMGVGLSIDDYGTGYASLAYLRELPVSELKIDRKFVTAVHQGGADGMIVRSTIELGHSLGMRVVAEGVEDEGALAYLQTTDCDEAQGFHFARPMAAEDLSAWLDARHLDPGLQEVH